MKKVLIMTLKQRTERFYDLKTLPSDFELVYSDYEKDASKLAEMGSGAFAIFADAIEPVSAELMEKLPELKIIHSEGVGYDRIDIEAAAKRNIFVCNNRAVNSSAVAEQTVMLMLAVLKKTVRGDYMVRSGNQIAAKGAWSLEGLRELSSQKVGLVGMGAIAKKTAKMLTGFGCEVSYYARHRIDEATETELCAAYKPLEQLLSESDIVSMHIPSNKDTFCFMDDKKFALMKNGAVFINTSRGEIVDQNALIRALSCSKLYGCGLDTISPEPVTLDNELINLPEVLSGKITFSPHIGGMSEQAFLKMHSTVWNNIIAVSEGKRPENIVNGI